MKIEIKQVSARACLLAVLAAVLTAGCSGINASKSVSPLDFILPGLHVQRTTPPSGPPAPLTLAATEPIVQDTTDESLNR